MILMICNSHRLGQVSWLVNIQASHDCYVEAQQLEGNDVYDRLQGGLRLWHLHTSEYIKLIFLMSIYESVRESRVNICSDVLGREMLALGKQRMCQSSGSQLFRFVIWHALILNSFQTF